MYVAYVHIHRSHFRAVGRGAKHGGAIRTPQKYFGLLIALMCPPVGLSGGTKGLYPEGAILDRIRAVCPGHYPGTGLIQLWLFSLEIAAIWANSSIWSFKAEPDSGGDIVTQGSSDLLSGALPGRSLPSSVLCQLDAVSLVLVAGRYSSSPPAAPPGSGRSVRGVTPTVAP